MLLLKWFQVHGSHLQHHVMEKTQAAKPSDEGSTTMPLGKLLYSKFWFSLYHGMPDD